MEKIFLNAEKRVAIGKSDSRSMRRQNMLPAVLYSKGISTPIKLQKKEIVKLIASGGGEHALITIKLGSDKGRKKEHFTIIKDYQLDPVRNELLHVDFLEISLEKNIKISTPIIITNEPIGVKKGGILQQKIRDIEVECLPTQIPDGIELDASSVDIGHSIHVSDLAIKEGIKLLSDPQDVVLTVSAPAVEEEPVPVAEEEVTEPELVKKGKTKEEEEAEGEKEEPTEQKEKKEQKEK
ncbi:MAG: 50S ribosomal protein L25 [Thermodesulfovibrionia bacterium]|nr:50S ribosomal protein L25 [Thermodesulfovibrionia bacterium]